MAAVLGWFDGAHGGRTVCMISPGNTASGRVAAKLGYVPIGMATYKDEEIMRYARER
jgi:RimJ/RimL family protein N-acetyltransferase